MHVTLNKVLHINSINSVTGFNIRYVRAVRNKDRFYYSNTFIKPMNEFAKDTKLGKLNERKYKNSMMHVSFINSINASKLECQFLVQNFRKTTHVYD